MRSQALAAPMGVVNLSHAPQADAAERSGPGLRDARHPYVRAEELKRAVLRDGTLQAGARLVFIALMSFRYASGTAWRPQAKLATDVAMTERGVRLALATLTSRELIRPVGKTAHGVVVYRFPLLDAAADLRPASNLAPPGTPVPPPPEPQFRQELERELEFSLPFGTKAPSRAPSKPSDARCARERAQRKAPTPVATYDAEAIAPAFAKAASAYGLSHDDVVIALRIAHDHDNGSIRRRNGGAPDDPRSGLHARLVLWLRKHGEQLQAVRRLSSRQPALPLVPKPSDDRAPTRAEQAAARARNASGARQVHPVDAGDDPRSMEEFRRLYAQQAAVRAALEAQRLAEHKAARQRIQ